MLKSVEKKRLRDSTDVPSHSGGSSCSQQSYEVVEDMWSEQSRSSSPIADDSGYNSSCDGPSDPFNISSQQNSEDADKSEYKPNKKNREPSKSVNQLEPSYHVSNSVFYYDKFNDSDLGDSESPLRQKFNAMIKDLEENKYTSLGDAKLIKGDGGVKYFRAKLSNADRLLFTSIKYNGEGVFVLLEVILNHEYNKSKFLKDKGKIKNIKIVDQDKKEVSADAGVVEVRDAPTMHWLGNFITFNAKQEDIVENTEGKYNLPLVVSGSAGSGKTSVALEKLRKIEEEFKEGKILYITKSENLIKKSKELYECEYYDEADNELKTGVPEQIEFLSLHEFIKRITKEDKGIRSRVERKKPIDRNAFLSWFNKKFQEDKKYKKDGNKIFEEFIAVIGGGGLLGENGKDLYMELGKRESIFPKEKRGNIYGLFEEYKKFIEGSSEYYDTGLVAHECVQKVQANYDAVVVDEVQDLTESTLDLILKSLKDESKSNFLLCGDVNQVIHPSFFSISRLKSFLYKNTENKELPVCVLEKNYRNSKQVIELANRILHFKNYCFASEDKITEKEKELFFMKSDTENTGNVGFVARDKEQEIAEKISESINCAVLVLDDKSKEDARKLFGTPLVFNIHEAKGLEFENVILYKFTSDKAYNKIWSVACPNKDEKEIEDTIKKIRDSYNTKYVKTSRTKYKENKSFEEQKFYINALYVGVTRAIDSVYILDNEKKYDLLKVIKPERIGNVDIKKEESSLEEWRDMALKLIDEGNVEQAKDIAKKLSNKEYVQEIISVLEARGYHRKAREINDKLQPQFSLGKEDKLEQTKESFSELKTENSSSQSPQKCSMGDTKSRTQTKKARKREDKKYEAKQDPNEDQEKKPKELCKSTSVPFLCFAANEENSEGCIPLHLAAQNGNKNRVELFLNHGADVNAKTSEGVTPLHLAAKHDRSGVVKLLLNRRANVDAKTSKSATPLHVAVQNNCKDTVKLLLNRRANVNAKTSDGYTPLHLAAKNNCKDIVKLLLDHSEINVNAKTSDGFTPLHLAAKNGHYGIVGLLLNNKADVNAKTSKSATPLYFAAQNGHEKVVKLLLEKGANVNAKTSEGVTPLYVAAKNNCKDIVKLLLDHSEINVNAKISDGFTPLHLVAYDGHDSIVKLLLDHSEINVNAKNREGHTPLHLAAQSGHEKVVNLLLEKGANVNAKTSKSATPLHLAAEGGFDSIVKLLLDHSEINVNAKTSDGFTPLHLAAEGGFDSIVELLLNNKADVNAKDKNDCTPLYFAAQNGHEKVVNLLLADSNINVGCVKIKDLKKGVKEEDLKKFIQKSCQDKMLFDKVKEAAEKVKGGDELGESLKKELEDLLKPESGYGFKPSLNYSPDGSDENTTIKIAIEASGKLLQLLYDYAEKNISRDTEIFKQLKHAKENPQPRSGLNDVSTPHNLAQAQVSIT